jgi:hypothetical protein
VGGTSKKPYILRTTSSHDFGNIHLLFSVYVAVMTSLNHIQDTERRQKTRVNGGDISVIQDSGRKLLYEYSRIPNEEMDNHIETIVSYYH